MGAPGMKFLIIGLVVMFGGYFLKASLEEWGPGYLYLVVEVIGLFVFLFGVFEFFKAKTATPTDGSDEQQTIRNDVLLNALARMTYADTNTKAVEVAMVRKIYKRETGKNITEAEIRVAARGDLHETKAFSRYLSSCGAKLSRDDKCFVLKAMAEIVKSDGSISPGELEFFDQVGKAFKLSPSEIAELRK